MSVATWPCTESENSPSSRTANVSPLTVIQLRGTQAEMGAQHGRILTELGGWERAVDFYPRMARRLLTEGNRGPTAMMIRGLLRTVLWHATGRMERDRPAPYLERTRALGEALGLPARLSRHMMVMDLFQNTIGLAGRLGHLPIARQISAAAIPACASLMVWGQASSDGELRHARNFDLPGIGVWDTQPTAIFCEPDEGNRYGFITTRGADAPATAFNEAGLVVTAQTRFHRDVAFTGAAIVDLCHDIVRRAETLNDAAAVAAERPIGSTWGLAVSSAAERGAIVIETNAKRTAVVRPSEGQDWLACSNWNRHPSMLEGQVEPTPAFAEHSDAREARMQQVVHASLKRGGMDCGDLERMMADHEEVAAPGQQRAGGGILAQPITVKTVVAEPDRRSIRVAVGEAPTSHGPFTDVPWVWDSSTPFYTVEPDASAPERDTPTLGGRGLETGPAGEAYSCYVEATRLEVSHHDDRGSLKLMERACSLDPDAPIYRFMAGVLCMKFKDLRRALQHFDRGLRMEKVPFRRGQLLLWASRAAMLVGESERALQLRRELSELRHPRLQYHKEAVKKPYRQRHLRQITVSFALADAH